MLLRLFELVTILAILLILATQVVIPLLNGQKIFPIFRKQWKLEHELEDAQQQVVEQKLQKEIQETQNSIKDK